MPQTELHASETPSARCTQADLDRARRALDDKILLYSRRRKRLEIAGLIVAIIFITWSLSIVFAPNGWTISDHASFAYMCVFLALVAIGFVGITLSIVICRLFDRRRDLDAASLTEIAELAPYLDVPAVKSRMQEIAASGRELTHDDCRALEREGASGHAQRAAENALGKVRSETGLRCQ